MSAYERIRIHRDGRTFARGGERWFYLADTAWSGVTNADDDEWERYLDRRTEQGFTAIQINLLPQWDRSPAALPAEPFAAGRDGSWDFTRPERAYFERAGRRLAAVSARGLVPVVVLLWCNFVPDTWASRRRPGSIIPEEALAPYLRVAIDCSRPHGPLYMVSGDTDFQTDRSIAYYATGLRLAKELDPDALTTLHVKGGFHAVADELLAMKELDFYTFQSGHGASNWNQAHELARAFRAKTPARPIVNSEPCYEGHGHGGGEGRYDARDVRQAAWQSLLAGANAGVTYGAHGIWSWHRRGQPFGSVGFSGIPFGWDEALAFPGADDYGFARHLFEEYALAELEPVTLEGLPSGFVALSAGTASSADAASSAGTAAPAGSGLTAIALYLPYPLDLPLDALEAARPDAASLRWQRIDLPSRGVQTVATVEIDGRPHLWKGSANGDSLLIGRRA